MFARSYLSKEVAHMADELDKLLQDWKKVIEKG
jgi:hypothetical protein